MVWISGDGRHRGQALRLEAIDRLPAPAREGMRINSIKYSEREIYTTVQGLMPGTAMLMWRGICNCGWRGSLWGLEAALTDANVIPTIDTGTSEDASRTWRSIEDGIHEEWRAHLPAPASKAAAALAALERAALQYRQARQRLETAVAMARAAGASWAQIGQAVGISRKAAYKRWGYEPGPASHQT